jgi:serine/threonine protein kinase
MCGGAVQDLHMSLPPVQEIEDNTGGVLRLKDGTPLPPYLAMPRGLPLPDWYAMHRPRQVATLAMLSQLLYRLDKLHVSGYCHNDIKPANMVLLDGGTKKKPEWHIVDFTNMSQIGALLKNKRTKKNVLKDIGKNLPIFLQDFR